KVDVDKIVYEGISYGQQLSNLKNAFYNNYKTLAYQRGGNGNVAVSQASYFFGTTEGNRLKKAMGLMEQHKAAKFQRFPSVTDRAYILRYQNPFNNLTSDISGKFSYQKQ